MFLRCHPWTRGQPFGLELAISHLQLCSLGRVVQPLRVRVSSSLRCRNCNSVLLLKLIQELIKWPPSLNALSLVCRRHAVTPLLSCFCCSLSRQPFRLHSRRTLLLLQCLEGRLHRRGLAPQYFPPVSVKALRVPPDGSVCLCPCEGPRGGDRRVSFCQ